MRYLYKNRWIPKHGQKFDINKVLSVTDLIHKQLNETYHVYNKDNKEYNIAIKNALNQCIEQYKNKQQLVYFNNKYYTYAPIKCNFDNLIKSVYIYMSITENENIYNIAYPYPDDKITLFKSHIEKQGIINRKTKQVEYKDVEIFDKASIICECDTDILNSQNIDYYIEAVRYELIHILHETRKKIINIYAGEADYYAGELSSLINIEFPFWKYLKSVNTDNPSNKDLILIISACIYYLDTSEYSAWLDNYYSQLMLFFQYNRVIDNNESNKILMTPWIYQIMDKIYQILNKQKQLIISLFDFNNNTSYVKILKQYLLKVNVPNKNIQSLINHYLKRSSTFLIKCRLIYYNEFLKLYIIDFNQFNESDK